jgi:two-component system response regulator HydG
LIREVQAGRFREDLYYRLNVVALHVPPLRERREDIPLIAQHYLTLFAEKNHKNIKGFTPQAMNRLLKYEWPGNVRELMNAVERGVVLSRSEYLHEEEFTLVLRDQQRVGELHTEKSGAEASSLETVEKETILRALETAGGNKSEAARRLGITRRTLHLKLKKYGMM